MKKKNRNILIGVIFVFLLVGTLFYFSTKQSVLSFSKVNVGLDGQVNWVYLGSASNPGESYYWTYFPGKYTKSDGTQITPQKSIKLEVNPEQPLCKYQLNHKTLPFGFLGLSKVDYYELNNPEKSINVRFTDDNTGQTKILDGTTLSAGTTSNQIQFNANGGKLTIETQGLLAGKYNCPEYSNTVMIKFDNGQYGFYKRDSFTNYFSSHSGIDYSIIQSLFSNKKTFDNQVGQDNTFTNSFKSYPSLNSDGTLITGSINFGYPLFTITGDQKYFASTTYLPPKDAKPIINSISIPSKIQEGDTNSMIVTLTNNGAKGNVLISVNSNDLSISPSSINLFLDKTGSQTFNIIASKNTGYHSGKVQVCAISQFEGEINCNSKSFHYTVTQKPSQTYCGDGICQTNENNATCPLDCNIINPKPSSIPSSSGQCGAWISLPKFLGGGTIIPDIFCLIGNLFAPIKWIIAILSGILAGIFGFKVSGDLIGKKKKDKWIPIVLGITLAGAIFGLIFIYFWWGVVTLIILGLIKWAIPKIPK